MSSALRLELVPRPVRSLAAEAFAPLAAALVTLCFAAAMLTATGYDPGAALHAYFVEPLTEIWSLHELAIKAAPLIIIAVGLCVAFRSSNWNIGAEGQFIAGAIAASSVPVLAPSVAGPWVAPVMLALGLSGGAAWGAIPGSLKARFGASEILVSLMLVYVAQLLLDYLVRGPWRNPDGFNFPETRFFPDSATLAPLITEGDFAGRANIGIIVAVVAAVLVAVFMSSTWRGFALKLAGDAPKAARFAGVSVARTTVFAFLVSGALAGLAGAVEVMGALGQLRPAISPGYGFTAIIVAFLARLSPLGAILAGLLLALTEIGGEGAQIAAGVSDRFAAVFQGMLLFAVLVAATFTRYRLRVVGPARTPAEAAA